MILTDISPLPNLLLPGSDGPAAYLEAGARAYCAADCHLTTIDSATLHVGIYYGTVAGTELCAADIDLTGAHDSDVSVYAILNFTKTGETGEVVATGFAHHVTTDRFYLLLSTPSLSTPWPTGAFRARVDTRQPRYLTLGAGFWGDPPELRPRGHRSPRPSNHLTCHSWHVRFLDPEGCGGRCEVTP